MNTISSTKQTPTYDEVRRLNTTGHVTANEELKLRPDGTVATKWFDSSTALGRFAGSVLARFGFKDGTQELKEKFLQEFQDNLKNRLNNDSKFQALTKDQQNNVMGSVDSLDLESFLKPSNGEKPAPKLTAKTLINFAKQAEADIGTKIGEFENANASVQNTFGELVTQAGNAFIEGFTSRKPLMTQQELNQTQARIEIFGEVLKNNTVDVNDPNLKLKDKTLIKNYQNNSRYLISSPQTLINKKIIELQGRLNAPGTTVESIATQEASKISTTSQQPIDYEQAHEECAILFAKIRINGTSLTEAQQINHINDELRNNKKDYPNFKKYLYTLVQETNKTTGKKFTKYDTVQNMLQAIEDYSKKTNGVGILKDPIKKALKEWFNSKS